MIVEANVMHLTQQGVVYGFPGDYQPVLKESIQQIYQICSKKNGFPQDACWWTTSRLKSLGLPQYFGYFILDTPIIEGRGVREYHNWNTDWQGRVVDLTLPQMNSGLKEKILIPITIVDSDTQFHKRFSVLGTQFFWGK